jgi:hypothetical protein
MADWRRRRYAKDANYRIKLKARQRERRYGISEERYTELWAQQGGVCAICLEDDEKKGLGVDHDHDSGAIRGLLCPQCNGAIGMFRERPDLMQRATSYLAIFA